MPGENSFVITPKVKSQIIKIIDERIGQVHVTKDDFSELKSIVRELTEAQKRTESRVGELAEAQKRTEARVDTLGQKMEELAEAQKRTEARVDTLGQKMEELAEAQKRTEARVDTLGQKMEELAEAQKRTESRVEELAVAQKELAEAQRRTEARVDTLGQKMEELAEAQKRTESRVEELAVAQKELAEAQRRTEGEIEKLTNSLKETRSQLGGLARSFSYAFENEAYRNIPKLLHERFGYEIKEKIVRAEIGGKEINIFCKAIKDGKEIYIVGESKVRLDDSIWRRDVFLDLEEKIDVLREAYGNIIIQPILVTHFATQGFLEEANQKGIIVIQSYEW